ncbi:hypothetical protein D3C81_1963540 [compost metagenome]
MQVAPSLGPPIAGNVVAPASGVVRRPEAAGEHSGINEGCPHPLAELRDGVEPLVLLDAAAVFVQQGAQNAVVDVAHVAGEQFVGNAQGRSYTHQLLSHEVAVTATLVAIE